MCQHNEAMKVLFEKNTTPARGGVVYVRLWFGRIVVFVLNSNDMCPMGYEAYNDEN